MNSRTFTIAVASLLLIAAPVWGQAERSVEKCSKEVTKRTSKYQSTLVKRYAKCFLKISKELIKDNEATLDGIAKSCASQLRKIVNTEKPTKTEEEKARSKMDKRCEPALNAHTKDDILSQTPMGVSQGIEAKNLDSWCVNFGGDGALDNVDEWIECQIRAAECQAYQQLGTQFPRLLEWLPDAATAIGNLGGDQKFLDAVQALTDLEDALDGNDDLVMDLNCGPGITDCGNDVVDVDEQCDGSNLDGESCISLGFANGGTLTCLGNCAYNLSGCFSGSWPKTGQEATFQAGDDGEIEAGPEFAYIDNGDGTITDGNTGLLWEKKGDDDGMHDKNLSFNWNDAFDIHIDRLNNFCDGFEGDPVSLTACTSDADCTGIGNEMCGHGGYQDWRLPNRHELQSIVHAGNATPAIDTIFNDNCLLNCDVLSCSCTVDTSYWTSTTHATSSNQAWRIVFEQGRSNTQAKTTTNHVRGVRGP